MEESGRNQTDSDDLDTGIECDPCLCDTKAVFSEWFCTECNEFLCDNCKRTHQNSKATRNHKLLDRDEMPRTKLTTVQKFCANHTEKQIKYFCEKHDQICCSVCATVGHRQCEVFFIDDIAGGFNTSPEYQDLLKQIKCLETKLAETKKQSDKMYEDVNQCFTTLMSDIQHLRARINTKLDEMENKVREEALKIKTDAIKYVQSISTQTKIIQKHLSEMSSTLQRQEKYKQNHQLFISSKLYLADVMEFKRQMEKISFTNHIKKYSFQCSEDIFTSLDTCCKLEVFDVPSMMYKDSKQVGAKFLKKINIRHKQDSTSYCWITGSDLLTCDILALADFHNSSVKLVDLHTDVITSYFQLSAAPRDLTCMDSNTVVVTCDTNLTFLKFDGKLSFTKQIPTEAGCYGIKSHQDKLFVTFREKPSVKIINIRGAVLHTIQTNKQGQNLFVSPQYITLSTDGKTIFVSDKGQNTVTSYSVTSEQLNVYKHEDLKRPVGLTVIENKFIFVCGHWSQNLHEISVMCEHIQIVLDRKDVIGNPRTVLYNTANNMIYISCDGNEFLSVFKLE